ncbi:hypothetical protein AVEN_48296-1 [Araneus ventricosus]|uniref:Uncharacterized protein n=1 Tax=Araneus ventricosus TaxID=182803 RepID=A0A4Y2J7Z0_ARAVE|nr:hypothetical protein AVEN_48296-1 [Araneus ventricosus]
MIATIISINCNDKERRMAYLHPRFCEPYTHGQLFPHENVWVMCFGEAPFELLELCGREPRPVPLLFDGFVVAGPLVGPGPMDRGVRGPVQPVQDLQRPAPRLAPAVAFDQAGIVLRA